MRVALPPPIQAINPGTARRGLTATSELPVDTLTTAAQSSSSGGLPVAKMLSTGVVGIGLAVPCTYAGMAGGSLVGGALGGALGPLGAALLNHGLSSALTTAWQAAGSSSHLGLLIGATCGLLGSFAVSNKLGKLLSREKSFPKPIDPKNPITFVAGTTLLTAGLSAGAVGGLALAGGAAAAGTIASGIYNNGFQLAALTGVGPHALACGAVGAAIAGMVGVVGSFVLTRTLARNVFDPLVRNLPTMAHKAADKYQQAALTRAAQRVAEEEKNALARSQERLQSAEKRLERAVKSVPLAEKELAEAKAQIPACEQAAASAEVRHDQIRSTVSSLASQKAYQRETYDVALNKYEELRRLHWNRPDHGPEQALVRNQLSAVHAAEATYNRLFTNHKDSVAGLESARSQHSSSQRNLDSARARLSRADSALLEAQLEIPAAEADLQRLKDESVSKPLAQHSEM